jgi:hypothetical protein
MNNMYLSTSYLIDIFYEESWQGGIWEKRSMSSHLPVPRSPTILSRITSELSYDLRTHPVLNPAVRKSVFLLQRTWLYIIART